MGSDAGFLLVGAIALLASWRRDALVGIAILHIIHILVEALGDLGPTGIQDFEGFILYRILIQ